MTRRSEFDLSPAAQYRSKSGQVRTRHLVARRPPSRGVVVLEGTHSGLASAIRGAGTPMRSSSFQSSSLNPRIFTRNQKVNNYAQRIMYEWGVDFRELGRGAFGVTFLIRAGSRSLPAAVSTAFDEAMHVTRGDPVTRSTQTLAAKFQMVRDPDELQDAIRENGVHRTLAMSKASRGPGLPAIADHVPRFYGSGWYGYQVYFTIMEPLSGVPLKRLVNSANARVNARLVHELERVTAALWAEGVAHMDAHTNNIFVTPTGRPMLIDFGQAVILPRSLRPRSLTQALAPPYLEQLQAYMDSQRMGWSFYNPNTRMLRVMRYQLRPEERTKLLALRPRANAKKKTSPRRKATPPAKTPSPVATRAKRTRNSKNAPANKTTNNQPIAKRLRPRR